jgi:hypothetical protein
MIELSVIMPVFRGKYIAWLPLEGLCRQTCISFDWELIIAEEQHNGEVFGEAAVMAYEAKLRKVGCKRIKYMPLDKWVPLSYKYYLMAQEVSPTSRVWVQQSADYYPEHQHLARHHKVFTDIPDVVIHRPTKAVHYDIKTNKSVLQDIAKDRRKDHCIGRAVAMDVMRQINPDRKRSGVDGWEWGEIQRICKATGRAVKVVTDESTNWQRAVSTFGYNNLTPSAKLFAKYPSYSTATLRRRIPSAVWERLIASRNAVAYHKFLGRGKKKRGKK